MFGDTGVLSVTDESGWLCRKPGQKIAKIKTLAGLGLCAIEIQASGVPKTDHKGF